MSKHDRCILMFIYISLPNVSLLKKSGRTGGRDCERGRNPKFVISPIVLRDSCAVYFYLFVFFFLFLLSIILKFILYSEAFLYGAIIDLKCDGMAKLFSACASKRAGFLTDFKRPKLESSLTHKRSN